MIVNGTTYGDDTDPQVASFLEHARANNIRLVFDYGNDWRETGYVGRSCGEIKVPLCIPNNRSMGGQMINSELIKRILLSRGKKVVYAKPGLV